MTFFAFSCRSEGLCPSRPLCVRTQLSMVFSRRSQTESSVEKFKINTGRAKRGDRAAVGSRVPFLSPAAAQQCPSEMQKLFSRLFLTHFKSRQPKSEPKIFNRYLVACSNAPRVTSAPGKASRPGSLNAAWELPSGGHHSSSNS